MRGFKQGLAVLVAALSAAACGGDKQSDNGKSGLPPELVLSKATDAQKLQFCQWFVSMAPADACGAPAAPDGGAPATLPGADGGMSGATETCLQQFSGVEKDCTVQAAEQCFSSWETKGSCKVPATAGCDAFNACTRATAPANGKTQKTKCFYTVNNVVAAGTAGEVDVEQCEVSLWQYYPCVTRCGVADICNKAFPDVCKGACYQGAMNAINPYLIYFYHKEACGDCYAKANCISS